MAAIGCAIVDIIEHVIQQRNVAQPLDRVLHRVGTRPTHTGQHFDLHAQGMLGAYQPISTIACRAKHVRLAAKGRKGCVDVRWCDVGNVAADHNSGAASGTAQRAHHTLPKVAASLRGKREPGWKARPDMIRRDSQYDFETRVAA